MGAVLAKFRKPKTTIEILENLEKNIKEIEQYSLSTQERQKRFVGNFLVISIGLYIIGFLIFYFAFFPPSWIERISYSVPLLIFPLLIFLVKRLVAWYFQRKLNKKSRELNKLMGEKKKIIERVMEKETYKKAIEILNRFADKSNGLKTYGAVSPRPKLNQTISSPTSQHQQQSTQNLTVTDVSATPNTSNLQTPQQSTDLPSISSTEIVALRNTNLQLQQQQKKTPFPIINLRQQGLLEKIVDYLIGDGPYNRYAMICKKCYGHNGMASQEEFEYSAYRCVYCNAMNSSRKTRPIAPKLDITTGPSLTIPPELYNRITERGESNSTSTSERESDPDTDEAIDETLLVQDISEIKNYTTTTYTTQSGISTAATTSTNDDDTTQIINSKITSTAQAINETDNTDEKSLEDKKKD